MLLRLAYRNAWWQRKLSAAIAVCWLMLYGGCGNSPGLVEVSGRITDGGKAVSGASINFQPIRESQADIYQSTSSFGVTDAEGRFQLRTVNDDRVGAVPGRHRIILSLKEERQQGENATRPAKRTLAKFYDGSTIVEIPADGRNDVDFDIADSQH